MDREPTGITFAVIGHLDNWNSITRLVNSLRVEGHNEPLSTGRVREVFGFIPPRKIFDIEVCSSSHQKVKGHYIETFISPDELDMRHLHNNLKKVKEACDCAEKLSADIVSLGGFTSIILEAAKISTVDKNKTCFTTGNTLTAAFIVKSIEEVCRKNNRDIADSRLLIIGSTGDIGSACATYFANSVDTLLLCARQAGPLNKQAAFYQQQGCKAVYSTNINELLPFADIVICVASSLLKDCDFDLLPSHAIICDAGYPKNILPGLASGQRQILTGGMGTARNGYCFYPDYRKDMYDFTEENTAHGCILESVVLAMEQQPMAYSSGRGKITVQAMNNIIAMAAKHGIEPAITFNHHQLQTT